MNIEFLKSLLSTSGDILTNGFGQITNYQTKQDQSNIVTEYDFQSEEKISQLIQQTYPEHNVLGEETGFIDKKSSYCWIIDPLDGTSNYAAGVPWFGVLIALLKDNEPILAGAYLPINQEMYYAAKNQGAYRNDVKIHVSSESNLKNILCCYSLDYSSETSKTETEVQIIKRLVQNCRNIRSSNCLLDFCYTADGRFGAAINQTMKIWDIAAPQLILEEAGALVTDINGKAIKYNPSTSSPNENFAAITANPKIHRKIMTLINN